LQPPQTAAGGFIPGAVGTFHPAFDVKVAIFAPSRGVAEVVGAVGTFYPCLHNDIGGSRRKRWGAAGLWHFTLALETVFIFFPSAKIYGANENGRIWCQSTIFWQ
jgi:hypothetical protein